MFSHAGEVGASSFVMDLSNWNTSNVKTMYAMFGRAGTNATTWSVGDLSNWNTSSVTNMVKMFEYAGRSATSWSIGDLSRWSTSNVTSFYGMFEYAGYNSSTFNIGNLSNWNTSKVTDMHEMFANSGYNAQKYTLDLSGWDTSRCSNYVSMFDGCRKLEKIYASPSFVIPNNSDTWSMFRYCSSLIGGNGTTYSYSHIDGTYAWIDGRIDSSTGNPRPGYFWCHDEYAVTYNKNTTDTVTNMPVSGDTKVYGEPLTLSSNVPVRANYIFKGWATSASATVAEYLAGGTYTANSEATLYAVWKVENATYISGRDFNKKIKRLAGEATATYNTYDNNIKAIEWQSGNFDIDDVPASAVNVGVTSGAPIYAWFEADTVSNDGTGTIKLWSEATKVKMNNDASYMFRYLNGLTGAVNISNALGLTEDTTNVTNMDYMFQSCGFDTMTSLDLGNKFNTSNVTSMQYMFYGCGCKSMTSLNLGNKFDTKNVTNMSCMFLSCGEQAMTTLNLGSKFDTSKVINMSSMFDKCGRTAMTSLDLGDKFDTSNVINMGYMFESCGYTAMTSLDLGDKFDTSKVTNMSYMFGNCGNTAMTNLDLGDKFDTSSVTDMSGMFSNCGYTAMTSLDLGDKFDTSKVTNMASMFLNCGYTAMTSLDLGDEFNTSNVINMYGMFDSCGHNSMQRLDLGDKFDTSSVTDMQFMFANCSNLERIYAPTSFVTTSVTSSTDMFKNSTRLVGGNGTVYDASNITATYAWIDGRVDPSTGNPRPGYFWCHDEYAITYNANAGTDTVTNMPANQTKNYGDPLTLSSNVPVRANYIFKGWATSASATVAEYLAGGTYTANSAATLYAVWKVENATYVSGPQFNQAIKRLAGNSSATSSTSDTNITAIQWQSGDFDIDDVPSTYTNVGVTSGAPIYAWFEADTVANDGTGTIKLWSEASKVQLDSTITYMFSRLLKISTLNVIDNLGLTENTTNVTNMAWIFSYTGYDTTSFNIVDLSDWDVSNVTSMANMFYNTGYNATTWNIGDLSSWNTSNVTNMTYMFYNTGYSATTWSIGDLSDWDTSSVKTMLSMFSYAGRSATTFELDLSGWDTSSVTTMSSMFSNAGRSATTWSLGDLSGWDTSSVTNMSSMFSNAGYSATTWNIGDLSGWDTSSVTDMSYMFSYAGRSATTWSLGDLSGWDTSSVTTMSSMFSNAGRSATTWNVGDLSGWDTSSVTNMSYMFDNAGYSATTWNIGDLSGWDTSSVIGMLSMFTDAGRSATAFELDLSKWDTSSVTIMQSMFRNAGYSATTWNIGDLSDWDTSSVNNMLSMFSNAGRSATTFELDLSGWDTSSITNMSYIFQNVGYSATTFELDLSGWDTSSATNMSYMFDNAGYSATAFELNLSGWDTSSVTNMSYMFQRVGYNGTTFELDLSGWDTSKVTDMSFMFGECRKLSRIYVSSSFVTTEVTNSTLMFYKCNSINGGNGTTFNSSYIDKTYAWIDGRVDSSTGNPRPGYFWCHDEYAVTYNKNTTDTVTNMPALGQTKVYGEPLTLSDNVPVRDGYTFKGWATTDSATDYEYLPGYQYSANEDAILYAVWEAEESATKYFTVKEYEIEQGHWSDFINGYIEHSYAFTDGMTFEQWEVSDYNTENVSIYSIWETADNGGFGDPLYVPVESFEQIDEYGDYCFAYYLQTHTHSGYLSFNDMANGDTVTGMPSNNPMEFLFFEDHSSDTVNLNEYILERNGYEFLGWTKSYYIDPETGDINYSNLPTPIEEIIVSEGRYSVYAIWRPVYTITYNQNTTDTVTNMPANQTKNYGDPLTLSSNVPVRDNYIFKGWATSASATVAEYLAGGTYTANSAATLYAVWEMAEAKYLPGPQFNAKIKKLAGNVDAQRDTHDTAITAIEWQSGTFSINDVPASAENVGVDSGAPIYAWFDNGTIKLWSEAEIIRMNEDASHMFRCFYGISGVFNVSESLGLTENTTNVTNMSYMFDSFGFNSMTSLTLGNKFDTSSVSNMEIMFWGCGYSNMTSLDLGNNFDTSNVSNMREMFMNCGRNAMTGLTLGNKFDTSRATNMNSMFCRCGYTSMTSLDLGENFDTSSVTNMQKMFAYCGYTAMTSLDLGDNFDTSAVLDMSEMFNYCGYTAMTSLDLGEDFDTSSVTNMQSMFAFCGYTAMTSLDLGNNFDTSSVTNMQSMFESCGSIAMTSIDLGYNFNTSKVTNMSNMFSNCGYTLMTSLDLGDNFDTSSVTSMKKMFAHCGYTAMTNLDLGNNFDTSAVTDMSYMFRNCGRLSMTSLDLGDNFDTSAVTDMSYMFDSCGLNAMTSLDLGDKFDTSSVNNMKVMFWGCGKTSMTSLDLGDLFNTSSVTNMDEMFNNCTNLERIYAPTSFVTTAVTSSTDMFKNSTRLVGGNGTVYNASNVTATYAWIDGRIDSSTGNPRPGYFWCHDEYAITYNKNTTDTVTNMPANQTKNYGDPLTLSSNVPVRANYIFKGWATSSSATVAEYLAGGTYTANSAATLYAVWISDVATYLSGTNFNTNIKRLAGNSSASYGTRDSAITSIAFQTSKPADSILNDSTTVNVGGTSGAPIYAWFDNGTIKLWSEATHIKMNNNAAYMFHELRGISGAVNVSNILGLTEDTSNVTNMRYLFDDFGYESMTSLELGDKFNTSNVTNMYCMFMNCGYNSMTSLDLGNKFDTSNVTDMNMMFDHCGALSMTSLDLKDKFDTKNVTIMSYMFEACGLEKMTSLDLGDKFDTSNVINMMNMFKNCGRKCMTSLDLGDKFDTSNVLSMYSMFYGCGYTSMTNLDLGDKFDTSKVTNMESMFRECGYTAMTSLDLGDKFDTSKVTTMESMFRECGYTSMTSLDLGDKFDTSNVTTMRFMFQSCGYTALPTLNLGDIFDTSNVTDMTNMFKECGFTLMTNLDLGNKFDTSNVEQMLSMFEKCGYNSLTTINLGDKFDTSKVTTMENMFISCGHDSMTILDLGDKFDTSCVTSMNQMFYNCPSLERIYAPTSFVTTNVTRDLRMFDYSTHLVGGNGTVFDSSHTDGTYAWIDGRYDASLGTHRPGYFWNDSIDTTPPTPPTITVIDGTLGNNGWYTSDVTVQITDGTDSGSGVSGTTYSLSGATTQAEGPITNNSTFVISNEGTTNIIAYTRDNEYNESQAAQLSIKIDKTAPTMLEFSNWAISNVSVRAATGSTNVYIAPSDSVSGVSHVSYYTNTNNEWRTASVSNGSSSISTASGTSVQLSIKVVDNAGNESEAQFIEYFGKIMAVAQLYNHMLNRAPEFDGMMHWVVMDNMWNIAYGIIFSSEANAFNYSNSDFVARLYRAVLGREGDSSGLSNHINDLNTGVKTREEVLKTFLNTGSGTEYGDISTNWGFTVSIPQSGGSSSGGGGASGCLHNGGTEVGGGGSSGHGIYCKLCGANLRYESHRWTTDTSNPMLKKCSVCGYRKYVN